jgi:hypothetical protein
VSQERWDVIIRVLDGPLAGLGEQTLKGPVVRIGVSPGPGGLALAGYRGLDARQAVITAYEGGNVSIAAVGANQVRTAPHPNVDWKDIDPIKGPEYLNDGCAIHLGPVGRGATIEFVKAQRLGVWTQGGLASEGGDVAAKRATGGGAAGPPPPPGGYKAKKVRTSYAPLWFVGCLFMMASVASVALLTVAIVNSSVKVQSLGADEPGFPDGWFDQSWEVPVDKEELNKYGMLDGMKQPFAAFVMEHNADKAGDKSLLDPSKWDQKLYDTVAANVVKLGKGKSTFRKLDEIRAKYAKVVLALRKAGLPEAFAGIPYAESRYNADAVSEVCAVGFWQFMPEIGYRMSNLERKPFAVKGCTLINPTFTGWEPSEPVPPFKVAQNAEYIDKTDPGKPACRISRCDQDDRSDIDQSTEAAILTIGEAYADPTIAASGAAVQIAIASHNAGYNDAQFTKKKKPFNMLPELEKWKGSKKGDVSDAWFYGENLTCQGEDHFSVKACGGVMPAQTQQYAPPILAIHFLAVCYYGKNYPNDPAFQPYAAQYIENEEGYCAVGAKGGGGINVPDKSQVK